MIKLLSRTSVGARLGLIGLLGLATVTPPTVLFVDRDLTDLTTAQAEARGVREIRALQMLERTVQGAATDLTPAGREAIADAVQSLQAELAFYSPDVYGRLHELGQQVAAFAMSMGSLAAPDARRLAEFGLQVNRLRDEMLDASGLSLDPLADTYNLMLLTTGFQPRLIQQLAVTHELLKAQGLSSDPAELARLDQRLARIQADLQDQAEQADKVSRLMGGAATDLNAQLQRSVNDLSAQLSRMRDSLQGALRGGNNTDKQAVIGQTVAGLQTATDTIFTTSLAGLALLEESLGGRESSIQAHLWQLLAALGVLIALSAAVGVAAARSITRQLGGEPDEVVSLLQEVAAGDLSRDLGQLQAQRRADPQSILGGLVRMQQSLQVLVRQLGDNSAALSSATQELAAGQQDLSSRTERQASALEQTSASTEELMATVRQNVDNARTANGLAQQARQVVEEGSQQVESLVGTMGEIQQSSRKVVDIVAVIEGIAFQTNLLALNAAVEAARAGEQGRGFAVVAGEVRSLAQRADSAAKEIKTLIDESVGRVSQGAARAGEAGQTMHQVVARVVEVAGLLGTLQTTAQEQGTGLQQVGEAVSEMDQMTQQNAAMVEQMAATAGALSEQASGLQQAIARFRLGRGAPLALGASS